MALSRHRLRVGGVPPNYALNLSARAVGRFEQPACGGARRKLTLLR
jgi:hypothetical protein